jgi:RNA polymerase sigma-70 factor (subfamily 1)
MKPDATNPLEPFRKYLEVLAELHLDRRLRGKLDPADLVQQTMLRAHSSLGELRNPQPEVLVAWLRRILARTLADAVKHYERDKRDVALERSLEADLDRSASGFAAWLAADQTSPSGRAERNDLKSKRGLLASRSVHAKEPGWWIETCFPSRPVMAGNLTVAAALP